MPPWVMKLAFDLLSLNVADSHIRSKLSLGCMMAGLCLYWGGGGGGVRGFATMIAGNVRGSLGQSCRFGSTRVVDRVHSWYGQVRVLLLLVYGFHYKLVSYSEASTLTARLGT
jgi:hypothetical protein